MRRYDDPVEVRRGWVEGPGHRGEGPEQFLWRGRLWKVADVLARWVETGPWWQSSEADATRGTDEGHEVTRDGGAVTTMPRLAAVDLLAEREVWRVEASAGRNATREGRGVFDLVFDWADGTWQLARCLD